MAEGLTTMLADVSNFVSTAFTWATDIVHEISISPILFIFVVAVPLAGLGVGLVKRLINV